MMEEYNNIDVAKIGEELEKMREQFEYLDNKLEIDSDSEAEKDLILE